MNTNNRKPRIAVFGLGTMGSGMARRLIEAGYELTVFNRNAARSAPLAALGAHVAPTPRDAAKGAGVLLAMLADDVASREVWLGEHGALAGADPGAMGVECSTLTVPWVKELAADCRQKGLRFLDAPVTGSRLQAAAGELIFLVGGDAATLDALRPVLAPMCKDIIHFGPTGAGAAFKLVNNLLAGVQAVALAEAYVLLERSGVDMSKALATLGAGPPGSPLVKLLLNRHTTGDPSVNFQLRLLAKDIAYALAEAQLHRVAMPCGHTALQALHAAMAAGFGDQDMASIIKFRQRAT
jgi:3-hydroxyisobutyrate dehydrogenase